jgi:hypothetical protein
MRISVKYPHSSIMSANFGLDNNDLTRHYGRIGLSNQRYCYHVYPLRNNDTNRIAYYFVVAQRTLLRS